MTELEAAKTRPDLLQKIENFTRVADLKAASMYPYFQVFHGKRAGNNSTVLLDNREYILFSTNDYLGLTAHAKVREAAIRAVSKYGTGCGGSRLLNGNFDLHEILERHRPGGADEVHVGITIGDVQRALGTGVPQHGRHGERGRVLERDVGARAVI